MAIDLDKIQNISEDDRTIDENEFLITKKFMKDSQIEPDPALDVELENNIKSMLNRWKVIDPIKRQELIPIITKMYYYRLKTNMSRGFWRLLKANLDNIST